jgi:hypothetical protein
MIKAEELWFYVWNCFKHLAHMQIQNRLSICAPFTQFHSIYPLGIICTGAQNDHRQHSMNLCQICADCAVMCRDNSKMQ